ncbi:MAG: restriction endonuclease subunit S [Bacteroidetes bacterium]|nr:restriction endonuclease subunit S [Bacteroidota bacterium]
MSKEKLIPALRFSEFKEGEEWAVKKLGLLTNTTIGEFVIKTRQDPNSPYPVYNGGKSYTGFYNEYNNEANKIVISARGANAGFVNLVKQKYWAGNSCYSVEILEQNKINLELLFYYIKRNQRRFTDNQQAANIPSVSKSDVEKFKICYPEDILEQQKIATCLSSLDEVIAAHSQKLELLKNHKKGLMQNLFPQEGVKVPKYRFKEFEKDGEWIEKKLGELIELKGRIGYRGYTLEDIVGKGEGAITMSPSNINVFGTLSFTKSTYITWAKYEESPEIMLENGFTVLVKTGSTYGKVAFIKDLTEKTTINPQLVVLKPKKVNSYFLYLLVANESIQKQINATVVGGAIPTLSQESISNFEILVPKTKEQEKIAECLSSLNELIISQTEKIEQLQKHKKGLMQGLFPKIKE